MDACKYLKIKRDGIIAMDSRKKRKRGSK